MKSFQKTFLAFLASLVIKMQLDHSTQRHTDIKHCLLQIIIFTETCHDTPNKTYVTNIY